MCYYKNTHTKKTINNLTRFTDKPKFVAFLVFFFFTTASYIAQISSFEIVLKREAILAPVAKQWTAKDIPSYGSRLKRAKIATHWFGKWQLFTEVEVASDEYLPRPRSGALNNYH